ncbi:MAG: adenylate/guanylate cyclase domain-containing protein [Bacteroidetes bacterium]|nr:adenylate/guanylate cyclase domain-containing protein [Bacteroidota bacterium]
MNIFTKIISSIARIGSVPEDDEDTRLQKALLVLCTFPFLITGICWGLLYIYYGTITAAWIPLSYCAFSLISIIAFGITKKFKFFRFSQLLLILLLPGALMVALGGMINGSAVILWALICPLGAMLFDTLKHARIWFAGFVVTLLICVAIQPYIQVEKILPENVIIMFFMINLIGVGGIIFVMVYYFVGQKQQFQSRSESLLLNILPKEIVQILKKESRTIAEHFENASILFADIVNFTPLSSTLSPAQLVELLNDVFSKFDSFTEKYQLEKIKTIGDCYMVASGVPVSRNDHALALTEMALEIRDYVNSNTFLGNKLEFRIGINSGPVVAGVIGRKKFSYDLWGDAVNIASRMESHGHQGTIQISEATYELIRESFICHTHGTLNIKGKGAMNVWYVTGKK